VRSVRASAAGKSYHDVSLVIDPARVAAFGRLFGEQRTVVPPTFLTAVEFAIFPEIVGDPDLALDLSRVVHAEQEYEWHRPLVVGERIVARSRIASVRERGDGGMVSIETDVLDDGGERIARCRATMLERGS
jgi:acyl dehydratase